MTSMEATEDYLGISARVQDFQKDLGTLPDNIVVQKHITFGDSYILHRDQYFALKHGISERFELHTSQVILVGSGKLGFSIAPRKRYRHFGDLSDLDVAIVSSELFQAIWVEVFEYWRDRRYWERYQQFKDYLFRGWLRPDLLPPSIESSYEWFDFFRKLTASGRYGPYKISAGIYQSWRHLESYQQTSVIGCRESLEVSE